MSTYQHPYKEADFVIRYLLAFDEFCTAEHLDDLNSDFVKQVLSEAEKYAVNHLLDLNQYGDQHPPILAQEQVTETVGFARAYRQFVDQGWPSLSASEEYGGQGLPNLVSVACNEIWQSSNLAFSLCPLLGQGAITAIQQHGSDWLKQQFLAKLVSGKWTGTMNLTEASAGSDLAAITTRAESAGEHYKLHGQKVFITWGDHQMAENIIHLVLARLPNSPAGVKGLSLFVVPKFLLDTQGEPSIKNDLRCLSLEHKLGIHASPTCVMSYGNNEGAIGYLVGKEHSGLRYMFSMMNHARQSVGVQGLGISECAFQGALHYATSRIQGSDAAGNKLTIASYGDVRRMLMLMKSGTEAMRALCYFSALIDDQKNAAIKQHKASEEIAGFDASIGFLTPIVKGWCTELAQELVSLAMQVYGGAGYVEETGVAQHVRDARILTIYEGTTGIQALDFSIRKTLLDGGAQAEHFFSKIHQTIALLATLKGSDNLHLSLSSALDDAQNAVKWLTENPQHANSVAANYLQLWGYLMGGWLMAKSFIVAQSQLQNKASDKAYLQAKLMTCKFYTEHFLVRTKACLASISAGGDTIMSLTEQQFFSHVN